MSIPFWIGLVTASCSAALAVEVFSRWRRRRSMHLLLWGMGLLLYVLASISEIVLSFGWNALAFRAWYWAGALMIPPVLGQGSLHLLVRRKAVAYGLTLAIALAAYASLVWMLSIDLDASKYDAGGSLARFLTERYREILPQSPVRRILPPLLNGYGTLLLAGGAVYSAWLFLRKQVLPNRVLGNVFIALGGLLPALSGTLIKLADDYTSLSEVGAIAKYATILASVLLLWVGFRYATSTT